MGTRGSKFVTSEPTALPVVCLVGFFFAWVLWRATNVVITAPATLTLVPSFCKNCSCAASRAGRYTLQAYEMCRGIFRARKTSIVAMLSHPLSRARHLSASKATLERYAAWLLHVPCGQVRACPPDACRQGHFNRRTCRPALLLRHREEGGHCRKKNKKKE